MAKVRLVLLGRLSWLVQPQPLVDGSFGDAQAVEIKPPGVRHQLAVRVDPTVIRPPKLLDKALFNRRTRPADQPVFGPAITQDRAGLSGDALGLHKIQEGLKRLRRRNVRAGIVTVKRDCRLFFYQFPP